MSNLYSHQQQEEKLKKKAREASDGEHKTPSHRLKAQNSSLKNGPGLALSKTDCDSRMQIAPNAGFLTKLTRLPVDKHNHSNIVCNAAYVSITWCFEALITLLSMLKICPSWKATFDIDMIATIKLLDYLATWLVWCYIYEYWNVDVITQCSHSLKLQRSSAQGPFYQCAGTYHRGA